MVTFGGNAVAGASDNTNPFLSDKVRTFGADVDAVSWITGGRADYGNSTNPFATSMEQTPATSGGVARTQAPRPDVAWPPTAPPSVSCNPFITPTTHRKATYGECDFFHHGDCNCNGSMPSMPAAA